MATQPLNSAPIAFFLPALAGGGVEKNFLRLAGAFVAEGYAVDLVLTRAGGDYENAVPAGVTVHWLQPSGVLNSRWTVARNARVPLAALLRPVLLPIKSSRNLRHVAALADYLKTRRPQTLIAGMSYPNLVAIWARNRAGVDTRIVVTERNTLSQTIQRVHRKWRWRYLPALLGPAYRQADHVVAVSHGVADDLATVTGLSRSAIRTIYNPVVSPAIAEQAASAPNHAWFTPGQPPVILAAGRLTSAKRFDRLIRAFARVRQTSQARLLILGEGRDRRALQALAREQGVAGDVAMPGFADNPYAFMAQAAVFVLSSDYEGLPTVLIEALACGATVVATDCPSGPREILDGGRYGALVACEDEAGLASAISAALAAPADRDRQKARAEAFSLDESLRQYRTLCLDKSRSANKRKQGDRF
ncbi:glycosyltransferase [Salinisphaera sp. T5B8]|uniref:glycosyltransferase n=1 Tax=Salinisphaera sp. T5B8 TaxID=1304154 RepID=UPI00333E643C